MKSQKLKLLLVPLLVLIMGIISLSLMLLFQFRTVDDIIKLPVLLVFRMLGETTVAVLLFNFGVRWLNRQFPWNENWSLRAFFDLILAMIIPLIVISSISYLSKFGLCDVPARSEDARVFLYILPLVTSTMFLVIVEMMISVEEKGNLEIKLALIEKEQINSKYSALKEQLDHHFLFNNLSVLSSLIYEDVEKADRFIQDFSSTYRYVLHINQRKLVTVEEELGFIDNYLQLYKFRFENGFDFKVTVKDEFMEYLIPPLTLQVLVENAIKHNVVSCKYPLSLSIENKDDQLWVKNTYQEKETKEISTQTGQRNLIEKYKLLEYPSPEFKIENSEYIAIVPLIQPNEDTYTNN